MEGVVLGLVCLHDLPAALECVEVEKSLNHRSSLDGVFRYHRARVELRAVTLEDVLEPPVLVARRLRHRGPERRRIVLHPRVDAHAGEVPPKRRDAALMTRAREDPLVGGKPPRPDPEIDQRAGVTAREPHHTRSTVRSGGRVVRVDDPRVGDALVTVGERISVANRCWRVIPLLVAISEERVDVRTEATARAGEPLGDGACELGQAVGRHLVHGTRRQSASVMRYVRPRRSSPRLLAERDNGRTTGPHKTKGASNSRGPVVEALPGIEGLKWGRRKPGRDVYLTYNDSIIVALLSSVWFHPNSAKFAVGYGRSQMASMTRTGDRCTRRRHPRRGFWSAPAISVL